MEFDITHLDKKLVIQTLFAHSSPLSLGEAEYDFRKHKGDNVDGLTDGECELILLQFYDLDSGNIRLLDYHKGKPMKLNLEKKLNGRILVDSSNYDARNGKYRFFEAFLNIFSLDEILITKKGYKRFSMSDLEKELIRPKQQEMIFKNILKNTIQRENEMGKYWSIDEGRVEYASPFMIYPR